MPIRLLAPASYTAGALFVALFSVTLLTGVSQQTFERVATPDVYADALRAADGPLRLILGIDDVFIVAYVAATSLLVTSLPASTPRILRALILGAGIGAGLLDGLENHHILALLLNAERGGVPTAFELTLQMTSSATKWILAHAAFALVGVGLPPAAAARKAVRVTLTFVQLPLGAACWAVVGTRYAPVLELGRSAALLSGFLLMPWLARGLPIQGPSKPAPSRPGIIPLLTLK